MKKYQVLMALWGLLLLLLNEVRSDRRSQQSPFPFIFALPIRIHNSQPQGHPNDQSSQERNEENAHQRGEQSLVMRKRHPFQGNVDEQDLENIRDDSEGEDQKPPRDSLLKWNGQENIMILKVDNNFARIPNPPMPMEDKQEFESEYDSGVEEFKDIQTFSVPHLTTADMSQQRPQEKQVNYGQSKFLDYGQSDDSIYNKREEFDEPTSFNVEEGSEIYGTDPVVHYLKGKKTSVLHQELPKDTSFDSHSGQEAFYSTSGWW